MNTTGLTIYRTHDEWLANRRLGASDSAGILCEGYADQSVVSIWSEKAYGPTTSDDEDTRLTIGTLIEPVLRKIFSHITGLRVHYKPYAVWTHPEFPWMTASLDGWVKYRGEIIPVELKNVSNFNRADWNGDEPPLRYQIQVQHQMAVTGAHRSYVMGLIGGNEQVIKEVTRNDRFIAALIEKLTEFWGYVERKEMPPVDGSYATSRVLSKLWPDEDGTPVELPEEATIWDQTIEESKTIIKKAEGIKLAAENKLKAALAEQTSGIMPDGSVYTWKNQTRKEHVVKESTFRVLRKSAKYRVPRNNPIEEPEHASSPS